MSTWRWVLHDAGGSDLRSSSPFSSKEEAEAWMGEHWSELLDEGAESVVLMSEDKQVYEMGLRES